jgi:hypothetical protein
MTQRGLSHPERQLMRVKTLHGLAKIKRYNYRLQQHLTTPKKLVSVFLGQVKRQCKLTVKRTLARRIKH